MEKSQCKNCRYFDKNEAYPNYGQCRKNAPSVALIRREGDWDNATVWPDVTATDWCGEFDEEPSEV